MLRLTDMVAHTPIDGSFLRSPFSPLPAISAVLLGLIFYKVLPAIFVFVALVPLFVFIDWSRSVRVAAAGGFVFGGIYFLFALHPLAYIEWYGFVSSEQTFMQVAYGTASVVAGMFFAVFAGAVKYVWRRHWSMGFFVAAFFVFIECAKRFVSFGFTWGYLGYLVEDLPSVLLGASVVGVLGLSFLVVCVNTGIALAVLEAKDGTYRAAARAAGCALLILAGVAVVAEVVHVRLGEGESVRVAVTQTLGQRGALRLDTSPYEQLFAEARERGAELIVMPETLIDTRRGDFDASDATRVISALADDFSGTVAVGGVRREDGSIYNSFFLWHGGEVVAVYDKRFLVPFGEYAPRFASSFGPEGHLHFVHGTSDVPATSGGMQIGIFVCQEALYPEAVRKPVQGGAELLISGANDGFANTPPLLARFAPSDTEWLHRLEHTYATFRAVENGRYLARSTKIGVASVVSPRGEVLAVIPSGIRAVEVVEVRRIQGMTPYTQFGDAPLLIFSLLLATGIIRRTWYAT